MKERIRVRFVLSLRQRLRLIFSRTVVLDMDVLREKRKEEA
jgi:hypothetical protein